MLAQIFCLEVFTITYFKTSPRSHHDELVDIIFLVWTKLDLAVITTLINLSILPRYNTLAFNIIDIVLALGEWNANFDYLFMSSHLGKQPLTKTIQSFT